MDVSSETQKTELTIEIPRVYKVVLKRNTPTVLSPHIHVYVNFEYTTHQTEKNEMENFPQYHNQSKYESRYEC